MKLLLTSAGITNKSLENALASLLSRRVKECNIAYVPTAANVESGDKGWLIEDLVNLQKMGWNELDIVDFSAIPRDIYLPRLQHADVICFSGGNTYHLIHMIKKIALDIDLHVLLKSRVYMGISAGSMVAGSNLMLSTSATMYSESVGDVKDDKGLNLVNFQIRPHLNSKYFPSVRLDNIRKQAIESPTPIYALDDLSAIKIIGDKFEVVSEGSWEKID
ncbi:MAG: Type 1 glutamine amidotransferase-like domain-containing protein [bacterium]